MVKNIVFDMGNVLFRFNASEIAAHYAGGEKEHALLLREGMQSLEWLQLDRGSIMESQATASICKRLPVSLHRAVVQLYESWPCRMTPIKGMEALVTALKQAGYAIYLLSNTSRQFHSYKEKLPGYPCFDGFFISADWLLLKPDPAIFRTFCRHFSLVPEECFFIDDALVNIEAAIHAGMQGHVFQTVEGLKEVLRRENILD